MQPLLGNVELDIQRCEVHDRDFVNNYDGEKFCNECAADGFTGEMPMGHWLHYNGGVTWVITGGKSGPNATPSHPDWFRSIRDQCQAAGVAFHFKQWGEHSTEFDGKTRHTNVNSGVTMDSPTPMYRVGKKAAGRLLDGRTWDEFPEALCLEEHM